MAVFGQDAFRVKLYAFCGQIGVSYAHDFAIICPCGDLQAGRERGTVNCEGVVAVDRELPWQASKYALLVGSHEAGFAVHLGLRAHNVAAKSSAYGLVPKAYAKYGQLACKVLDGSNGYAGFVG